MKKKWFLWIIIGEMLITGCTDDSKTILRNHHEKRLVARITADEMNYAGAQDWEMRFSYDAHGNLRQLLEYSIDDNREPWNNTYTFTRVGGILTEERNLLFYDEELEEQDRRHETVVHTLSNQGRIIKSEQTDRNSKTVLQYVYNENGEMMKVTRTDSVYNGKTQTYECKNRSFQKFLWEEGNMVSSTLNYDRPVKYRHTEQLQLSNFDLVAYQSGISNVLFSVDGYRGKMNENFIASELFYYTWDDEGYVYQIRRYEEGVLQCIYTFEYTGSVE